MLKKRLNTLKIIKTSEIKHKRLIAGENLFDDLPNIILTNKTLKLESQEDKNKEKKRKIKRRE